jgi:hypothetical protein
MDLPATCAWSTKPSEKRLSYERDRRNTYGENDKSSRKNIPRGKRLVRRAARRAASVALAGVRGSVDSLGVVEASGNLDDDGGAVDRVEQRIARRRRPQFRKWRDEPLGDVVAYQLGHRGDVDPAAAAVADARIQRVRHRLARPPRADDTDIAAWISQLAMIDRQIRLRDGDRMRHWVTRRLAVVRRAQRAGAFTPYEVALQDARFVAGLHRDNIAAAASDLLPPVDVVVRECLARIPLSQREVRAARPDDTHRVRDTFRLVDAVGPLTVHIVDPALAIEMRTWRRLRNRH